MYDIGYCPEDAPRALEILTEAGERASVIGKVVEGEGVTLK